MKPGYAILCAGTVKLQRTIPKFYGEDPDKLHRQVIEREKGKEINAEDGIMRKTLCYQKMTFLWRSDNAKWMKERAKRDLWRLMELFKDFSRRASQNSSG